MRCKVGDLVVIVRVRAPNMQHWLGRIVTVIDWLDDCKEWITDGVDNGSRVTGSDAALRPIRDSDGTDETLTWKQLPSPVELIKELAK
jgi:hypothetical protein